MTVKRSNFVGYGKNLIGLGVGGAVQVIGLHWGRRPRGPDNCDGKSGTNELKIPVK